MWRPLWQPLLGVIKKTLMDEYYAYQDRFGFWRTTNNSWTIPNETRVRNDFKTKQEAEDWIAKEKRNGIDSTSRSSNKVA